VTTEVGIKGRPSGLAVEIEQELESFEREAQAFLRGERPGDDFRRLRLQHGIYGQRQADQYMMRVKIPHGSLTADQLEVLAGIADRFALRRLAHVTTRQDVQLHFVPLADVPTIMWTLARAGLTTREASGNTVRNVTADPVSGLCADTAFDVTPHAEAVARHFLRHPGAQKLPRKFKVAFSACPHDHGLIPIHDLGAMAVVRRQDGLARRGFQVSVGGGLGAVPRVADVLDEFVPEDELVRTVEAVLRVYDRLGERRNRNKARIKFLVARVGIEEFRRLVREELKATPPVESGVYRSPDFALEERPSHPPATHGIDGRGPPEGFEAWRATNASPQRQPGYYLVHVTLPMGDLTVEQMRALVGVARRYAGGRVRTTVGQNMVLRWVHEVDLPSLYADLVEAGLGEAGAGTLPDVMACAGTDTCSQGITSSRGLADVLRETMLNANGLYADPLVRQMRIKVSGCLNSCGHHDIADVGFCGCAVHSDGRLVPAFHMLVGGRGSGEGVIGQAVMKVVARRVPDALARLIAHYVEDRQEGEPFGEYVRRVGTPHIREVLAEFKGMPVFGDDPMGYVDWGASKLFSLDERGEGECAM
jgi:sulfite reductase beta subunit-like hemoprotein